jgi:hypothetical protein
MVTPHCQPQSWIVYARRGAVAIDFGTSLRCFDAANSPAARFLRLVMGLCTMYAS